MTTVTRPGRRRAAGLDPHSSTFAQFADVLYAGVLIVLFSLPLVTWFAAFSAGVQALRESRALDRHVSIGTVWRPFLQRVRRSWAVHLLLPIPVTALLTVNIVFLPYTDLGPHAAQVISLVLAAVAGALALRVAGVWRPDVPARVLLARAWRLMPEDPRGSGLLVIAVAAAGSIVAVIPLLALVIPGPLALAAVAMDESEAGGA